jgi:hypothetical protein
VCMDRGSSAKDFFSCRRDDDVYLYHSDDHVHIDYWTTDVCLYLLDYNDRLYRSTPSFAFTATSNLLVPSLFLVIASLLLPLPLLLRLLASIPLPLPGIFKETPRHTSGVARTTVCDKTRSKSSQWRMMATTSWETPSCDRRRALKRRWGWER